LSSRYQKLRRKQVNRHSPRHMGLLSVPVARISSHGHWFQMTTTQVVISTSTNEETNIYPKIARLFCRGMPFMHVIFFTSNAHPEHVQSEITHSLARILRYRIKHVSKTAIKHCGRVPKLVRIRYLNEKSVNSEWIREPAVTCVVINSRFRIRTKDL
jgi:hypothetical protein